uniref:Uncharacterized protein n=1 Tax=Erwinia amylovora ATCC BAA-2158 TaxID=889211 RepID=E5B599_ERWAM|nr:hypothetical protein predicted by Glimmer/Critica [Erwinia amylovora ATCC BAA-2158]
MKINNPLFWKWLFNHGIDMVFCQQQIIFNTSALLKPLPGGGIRLMRSA